MANKILLVVSSTQVVAAHWLNGKLARCETLTQDDDGVAAFAGMLRGISAAPAYIAVDTVEEDYRFETLPHATGADRNAMLDRKIRHFYRGTRFVSTLFLGRTGQRRSDDRYLFSALTNAALIEPWLAAIAARGAPVAGIYLTPMLTAGLMSRLQITQPRVLIAAPHRSGLRLTFYKNGAFTSSRLTRDIPRDPGEAARMLATELSNTRLYLSTLHLDELDEQLDVVFLDRNDRFAPIAAEINAGGHGLECRCIGRAALLRHLPISPQHLDLALETVYLGVLAEDELPANLAPPAITAGYLLRQRKRNLYAASVAVGLIGLAGVAYNLWQTYEYNQQAVQAARNTSIAQLQYREITRTFPEAPTTSDNLIRAVDVYQRVMQAQRSPQPFMQLVSRALDTQPEVFLKEMHWRYGTAQNENAGTPPAPPAGLGALRQIGTLQGEIRPFQGDFRSAIASIHRVAEHLAREPSVADIKVLKLPLNVNPDLALSGDTRDAADHTGTAEFTIQITLRPNA